MNGMSVKPDDLLLKEDLTTVVPYGLWKEQEEDYRQMFDHKYILVNGSKMTRLLYKAYM